MAGRYLVTGVQLGLIKSLAEHDPYQVKKVIEEIHDKQYVGDTNNEISEDVLVIQEGKLPMFKR